MTHPNTPLYALAQIGAEQKYAEADALIERDGNYLEIAEIQYCAAILDDFASELYNDPAMWEADPRTPAQVGGASAHGLALMAESKGVRVIWAHDPNNWYK